MKRFYRNLTTCILLVALGVLPSCIDRLDFFGETVEGQLVIYGLLTDADEAQRVSISRTNRLGFNPTGVDGAAVTLITPDGRRLRYSNLGNGNYLLNGFRGTPGLAYSMEVLVDGDLYESSPQTMPTMQAKDSVGFRFGREPLTTSGDEGVFVVSTNSVIPASKDPIFLRYQAEEIYQWERTWLPCTGLCPPPPKHCFISDQMDPSRINLFQNSNTTSREFSMEVAKRVVDNSFIGVFYVSLRQLSINRDTYEYWRKIELIVSNRGSLFDTPPAPVFGNFKKRGFPDEGVLGIFEVAKVTYTRDFVKPSDVPFFLSRPCAIVIGKPAEDYAAECVQCEVRANGRPWSNDPPSWWLAD